MPRLFQKINHSLKGFSLSFVFFRIIFLQIGDWNEQFRNLNDILRNSERLKDPSDRIISFHYIDNFKKLFILCMNVVEWRSGKYAPIVQWFRTSLFQGGNGDSTSPGGRVLQKEIDQGLSIKTKMDSSWVDARAVNGDGL